MAIYAISDFHLAFTSDKPMDIFGDNWYKHEEKIKENWLKTIEDEDTVLIAGDISWSMKIKEGMMDLEWIHNLPGRKILVKGNHDYWWTSITKLNNLYDDMKFIQNNYFPYEDYAICGTRGWICPGGDKFTAQDEKIYKRELIRLRLSLDSAKKDGFNKFIVMLHYPPINDKCDGTEFIEIFREYNVQIVVYGHLHDVNKDKVFEGNKDGIQYMLTSCDYLDFKPIRLF
ncbi:hypothetical protein BD780_004082 [Clostridium tetanomorphum]|uniref:Serine/threonine protein phosphatase n=1 Tax=Clostridium tetanomorphum TaxID=1553 RepID=A0A923EEF6_CLOTT|nr:metallophosphoesterase [Clostridium tetanomorphum]KAJ49339.1 phosphohydrolase [Clostridium tetanomorphum DSM 665]KAJ53232.1 phosphohydrolase [Clostridium tetanomorphum DSM 665]MBC2399455.1 serine/threonine protein phosphatase [Clostridium tetanomorphum]MBP1865737.1 putative phosphohydrolase [Clostridium tetanomorphum]NRS86857.1 hypothetical protein [Clostridium tetanomorphum]